MRLVRFRTLGCYPLTAAVESSAATLAEIVAETLGATTSERQGRVRSRRRRVYGAKKTEGIFDGTLRFITCGSVDDGKSTLIGRLLYETKLIFEDQLEALMADSKKFGTQGERLDLALLVDGLQAEREQGITIDVAYRFFRDLKRRFIVADTPGHEQIPVHGHRASTADAAVLLIDARKGVLTQPNGTAGLRRCSASVTSPWRSTRWIWSTVAFPVREIDAPTTVRTGFRVHQHHGDPVVGA